MKQLKGLTDKVKGLDDQPVLDGDNQPLQVKAVIANAIARAASEDPMRAMDVATRFYHAQGRIVMDDADVTLAMKCIKEDRLYTNIVKVCAIRVLANAEDIEPNRAAKRRGKKAAKKA